MVESETWLPVAILPDLLPNSSPTDIEAMQWLTPTYVRDGQFSLHLFVCRADPEPHTRHRHGVGNANPRTGPMFNMLDTDFLDTFREVCDPTDVDSVVCTHLHADPAATRQAFFERFADTGTLVIGTQFGTPTGVYVHRDGDAFRLSPAG